MSYRKRTKELDDLLMAIVEKDNNLNENIIIDNTPFDN
jgi:hypothetical protein